VLNLRSLLTADNLRASTDTDPSVEHARGSSTAGVVDVLKRLVVCVKGAVEKSGVVFEVLI
jgi:hypothetical protein